MTAYDKTVAILSIVLKTFVSMILSVIAGLIVGPEIFDKPQPLLGWVVGLTLFWLICPADTKNWIKNWTKPQLTKEK